LLNYFAKVTIFKTPKKRKIKAKKRQLQAGPKFFRFILTIELILLRQKKVQNLIFCRNMADVFESDSVRFGLRQK